MDPKIDKIQMGRIYQLINLLETGSSSLKFGEILTIIREFRAISNGTNLPTTAHINNNVEQEALYEEEEIDFLNL